MSSTSGGQPRREQLVTADDLQQALLTAESPECLNSSDVLDRFIREETASMTNQLLGAGVRRRSR